MKKYIQIFVIIISVLAIDLISKHFLFNINYFNLIPKVISIASNGGNSGAAWGIFSGKTGMLIAFSIALLVVLFVFNYFVKNKTTFYCISFGFVVGGAMGNLADRIVLGYVRDFIYLDFFPSFPIFNLADSFLCIGAIMLAIYILFLSGVKEK